MNGTFSGLLSPERNLPQPIGMCHTARELSSFLSLCLIPSLIRSQIRHKVVALPLIGTLYSFRLISNPHADPSSPPRRCFERTLRGSARGLCLFFLCACTSSSCVISCGCPCNLLVKGFILLPYVGVGGGGECHTEWGRPNGATLLLRLLEHHRGTASF